MENVFVACKTALANITTVKKHIEKHVSEDLLRSTAIAIARCFSGKIRKFAEEISQSLLGNKILQTQLAFSLRNIDESSWVQFSFGFEHLQRHELFVYSDAATYLKCTHNLYKEKKLSCYKTLERWYKSHPLANAKLQKARDVVMEVISENVTCECHSLDDKDIRTYSCANDTRLGDACPKDHTCSSSVFPAKQRDKMSFMMTSVCNEAATCSPSVCDKRHYFDKTKTSQHCKSSTSCKQSECCLLKANCQSLACHNFGKTLDNLGSTVLCDDSKTSCTAHRCCYCGVENVFNLGIGCWVPDLDLETSNMLGSNNNRDSMREMRDPALKPALTTTAVGAGMLLVTLFGSVLTIRGGLFACRSNNGLRAALLG